MKMKNSFYSIWAKVVVCCFWMMTFSFLIVGLTVHLMNQLNVWNLLPWPLTGLHFILVLAIITTIKCSPVKGKGSRFHTFSWFIK